MAFNPFHVFRKHQKVVMAGMVLVAMVTFVLSSGMGRGDFFDTVSRWFSNRGQGSESFTVFGSKVTPVDLQHLQQQRRTASTFMSMATNAAMESRQMEIQGSFKNAQLPPEQLRQHVFQRMMSDTELQQLMGRMRNPYFGDERMGEKERVGTLDESIDFLAWRHEADRLNIHLSEADINKEVARLTNNRLTRTLSDQIQQAMRREAIYKSMTASNLINALGDEFRVRLARAALEGYEPGARTQVPAPVTPDQFWNFFKDNRTEIQVAMLTIPVRPPARNDVAAAAVIGLALQTAPVQPMIAATAALLAGSAGETAPAIKEKPTEADLQNLFRKYRTVEPNPESDTPGFKQPRRIQLQWVSTKSDDPEYKKAAAAVLAVTRVTLPTAYDIGLLHDYENAKFRYRTVPWTDPNFVLPYYRKPENVAATLGQALGDLSTQGLAVLPPAVYQAAALLREDKEMKPLIDAEAKTRIPVGASLILAGASPSAVLATLPPLLYAARKDQYLPLALVKDELLQRVEGTAAEALAASRLQNFLTNEIEERLKKPDARKDPSLPKELEAAARRYNLQTGMTAEPRTQYTIAQDEALQKLKSAIVGAAPMNRQSDRDFAQRLFGRGSARVYDVEHEPASFMREPVKKPIDDDRWRMAREPFLFWKTRDEAATIPTSLDKVRDQVVAAWYLQKARVLAQKEAERVAAAVPSTKGSPLQLRDFAAKENLRMFELGPIAQLMPRRTATPLPTLATEFESYRLPEDKIRHDPQDIEFAKKFVDDLLSLKDKAPGTAKVLYDQPKENYYVAVLVSTTPPQMSAFYLTYRIDAAGTPQLPDPMSGRAPQSLLARFEEEQRQNYRKEFMDQLRAQAGINANNPSKEFRRSYDNRGGSSED